MCYLSWQERVQAWQGPGQVRAAAVFAEGLQDLGHVPERADRVREGRGVPRGGRDLQQPGAPRVGAVQHPAAEAAAARGR